MSAPKDVAPAAGLAPAAGISEAEVEAGCAKWWRDFHSRMSGGTWADAPEGTVIKAQMRATMRAALEAAALARQPAHDTGQGAEPVAWRWRLLPNEHVNDNAWHSGDGLCLAVFERDQSCEVQRLYAAPQAPVPEGQSDGWHFDMENASRDGTMLDLWIYDKRETDLCWKSSGMVGWSDNVSVYGEKLPTAWRFAANDRPTPSPAPSNAGEDDGAFVQRKLNEWRSGHDDSWDKARLIALARRGLNAPTLTPEQHRLLSRILDGCGADFAPLEALLKAPTRPAGDEVTEAVAAEREACAQVADERARRNDDCRATPMFDVDPEWHNQRAGEARSIAAALRARTGR